MSSEVDRLLSWASPGRSEFVGYAFSEEHWDEITDEVAHRRREFLINAIGERLGGQTTDAGDNQGELDFSTLPLHPIMDREEHIEIATEVWGTRYGHIHSRTEMKSYWTKLADIQSRLMGHPPHTIKNNSFYLEAISPHGRWLKSDEKRFQKAVDDATLIEESGYPIRFLTAGVPYVVNSGLDMDTVETWVNTRDKIDYIPVYFTPQGFWPAMVEGKRAYDEARGRCTYADVVSNPVDGMFVAPYIDGAVDESPDFFHFDDIYHRAMLEQAGGEMATRALRTIVKLLCGDNNDQFSHLRLKYFRQPTNGGSPGAIFFRTDILPEVLNRAAEQGDKGKTIDFIELLAAGYQLEPDEYEELVFIR